jgi:hypothetical protein
MHVDLARSALGAAAARLRAHAPRIPIFEHAVLRALFDLAQLFFNRFV